MKTRVLALNAWHGGSHRAFLDNWVRYSRHEFTLWTLPAYKWKWRMRHAAVTFAVRAAAAVAAGDRWDVLFCTDMLNLAEFRGLAPPPLENLPAIVYFHENQLTYPNRAADQRDLHFAFTNLTTALAATRVWFNSAYHRQEFLSALDIWLRRMPDFAPRSAVDTIAARAEIHPPGIVHADDRADADAAVGRQPAGTDPLRIVWVSRWEHDKDPETFFQSLFLLHERGCDFRLSVLGERFETAPAVFGEARRTLAPHIDHWGYVADPGDYWRALDTADTVVSTARHEFFGIGILEAVAAGCFPLVPRRLAYPEVLGDDPDHFHDGSAAGLTDRLQELSERKRAGQLRPSAAVRSQADRFAWPRVAAGMDAAVRTILTRTN